MKAGICARGYGLSVCAAGAFAVNRLIDNSGDPAIWRQVAATFVIIATLAFVLTAELRRLIWAVAFALGSRSDSGFRRLVHGFV